MEVASDPNKVFVADYISEKDQNLSASLNLEDVELEVYDRYYKMFHDQVPVPDLVIYLQDLSRGPEEAAQEKERTR